MPKAVFPTPKKVPYCAPTAASEKYMMKKLGFTGTLPARVTKHIQEGFLDGQMQNSSPNSVRRFFKARQVFPEILAGIVAKMQHGMARAKTAMPPRLTIKSWVACHIGEIGCADEDGNLFELV